MKSVMLLVCGPMLCVGLLLCSSGMSRAQPTIMDGPIGERVLVSGPAFPVYDATLYQNKPDLESLFGMPRLRTHGRLWSKGEDQDEPIRARVIASMANIPRGEIMFLDIEHWPMRGEPEVVAETVRKFNLVTQWVREARPDLTIGYYSFPPVRDYWRSIKPVDSPQYLRWQADNRAVAPIADRVDIIYPSLYTFYEDREGWVTYAEANLREARQYGKPVYAFLWPQYHVSNQKVKLQLIEPAFWRIQLETCLEHADGIVIWGGWMDSEGQRLSWDPTAPWWRETLAVMAEHGERLIDPRAAQP
ncbi:MAG: hypothetical protein RLN76_07715 [Phycisphaeraceae bacterium]